MNSKKFQWTVTSLLSAASLFISGIATVNAETYEVKSGDTLSKIALENNTSVENIIASNNLTNEDLIYAGQIIELGERSKSMIDKVAPQEQANLLKVHLQQLQQHKLLKNKQLMQQMLQ